MILLTYKDSAIIMYMIYKFWSENMNFTDIIYLVVWAVLAAYCIYSARKLSPILYVLGVFFVFMFGWKLADMLIPVSLYAGIYNVIFRCIAIVFLVVVILLYVMIKRKSK